MVTITINVPDALAKAAESAGILAPERLAGVLEAALRQEAGERFFAEARRFQASGGAAMTDDEVMAMIRENRKRPAGE